MLALSDIVNDTASLFCVLPDYCPNTEVHVYQSHSVLRGGSPKWSAVQWRTFMLLSSSLCIWYSRFDQFDKNLMTLGLCPYEFINCLLWSWIREEFFFSVDNTKWLYLGKMFVFQTLKRYYYNHILNSTNIATKDYCH